MNVDKINKLKYELIDDLSDSQAQTGRISSQILIKKQ